MPYFEYWCSSCGHSEQVFCKYENRPNEFKCEKCGNKMEYCIAAGSFDIKGYSAKNGYAKPSLKRIK